MRDVLREERMKQVVTLLALTLAFTGCATFQTKSRTFEQAVHDSIPPGDEHQTVVIVVDKTGAVTVAGRPTSLEDIEGIRKVAGLTETPPAALIRGHREAKHADVRAVMDALTKAGIWRINFAAIKETDESQNKPVEDIRR